MPSSTATLQLDRRVLQLEQRNSAPGSPSKLSLRRRNSKSIRTPTILRRGSYGLDDTAYAAASSGERVSFVLKVDRMVSKRAGIASWSVRRENVRELGAQNDMGLPYASPSASPHLLAVGTGLNAYNPHEHGHKYIHGGGALSPVLSTPDRPPRSPSRAPSISLSISTRSHAHSPALARPHHLARSRKSIFVKWARGSDEVDELSREASLYANELKHLQGTVVPECYGYFVGHDLGQQFSCMFLEYCEGVCESYQYEYEMALQISRLHASGISHNALRHRHFVPYGTSSLRIVDFSRATLNARLVLYSSIDLSHTEREDVPNVADWCEFEEVLGRSACRFVKSARPSKGFWS